MKEILGMGSFNFVSVFSFKAISIDGVDIKVISFEFVILLIMIDFIGDELFSIVAALIDGVFGKFWFYNF